LTEKTSTFSNIFTCFTYLRKHVISILSNINTLVFKTLFDTIFVNVTYKRNKFKVFLKGYTAMFKRRLYRVKFYIPSKIYKRMKECEKPKRTLRFVGRKSRRTLKLKRKSCII